MKRSNFGPPTPRSCLVDGKRVRCKLVGWEGPVNSIWFARVETATSIFRAYYFDGTWQKSKFQ